MKVDLQRAQEIGHRSRPVVLVKEDNAQAIEGLGRVRPTTQVVLNERFGLVELSAREVDVYSSKQRGLFVGRIKRSRAATLR